MTDKTLDAIATHLPNIVNVDVENVTKLTAAGILRLIEQSTLTTWTPSSMEIDHTITGVSYVTRLYGEAIRGY
ncbi:hypothetical protein BCR42DRAFT_443654 [Absidia repens]|uniref:Uncharacterized protein n=1 Tax=Absidia repens TaxID=90262 RepID=A0A1X2HYV5_9FUNG|nr:hypothetical protein BCR42DRAFT_443654 [Absidia repens]